jgi:type III secretion system low calcium response chaperone LcrH/SycD
MPYDIKNAEQLIEKTIEKLSENQQIKNRDKQALEKVLQDVFIHQKTPKEAMGMSDKEIESLYSFGYNLFTHGKFLESRLIMDYLMRLNPEDARYPLACGAAFQQLKDYQMATAYYLLAFHLDQENPIPLYYMYECFKNLDEPRSAFMMLENIVERFKDKPEHAVLVERAKRSQGPILQSIDESEAKKGVA